MKLTPHEIAKLQWRCRRGMLELDILLMRFCNHAIPHLEQSDLERLTTLLETPDPELLAYLMGDEVPSSAEEQANIKWMRDWIEKK